MLSVVSRSTPNTTNTDTAATIEPDAELLALGREFDLLAALAEVGDRVIEELEEKAWDIADMSETRMRPGDDRVCAAFNLKPPPTGYFYISWADAFRAASDRGVPSAFIARKREIIEAVKQLQGRLEVAHRAVGLHGAKVANDAVGAKVNEIGKKILSLRATTLAGLVVKARCAQLCHGDLADEVDRDEFNDEQSFYSIVLDLLALDQTPSSGEASTVARNGAAVQGIVSLIAGAGDRSPAPLASAAAAAA